MSEYLVIGASSGIGKQLAIQLAEAGHTVYGTYQTHKMEDIPGKIVYRYCNVLDENMELDFLPDRLDGLVYCPGSINLKPFARMKPEEFVSDFQLQVLGAIKVIQLTLSKLRAAENPAIVMFSTVAVQVGFNFHSKVSTSKGAIEGLTRALAAEFAPTIRVNCIAPSLTDTPLAASLLSTDEKRDANANRHPLKKIGKVHDIANMAEYLLSEKAGWISGQVIHVDGGMFSLKV